MSPIRNRSHERSLGNSPPRRRYNSRSPRRYSDDVEVILPPTNSSILDRLDERDRLLYQQAPILDRLVKLYKTYLKIIYNYKICTILISRKFFFRLDERDRLLYQQAQQAANPIAATSHNDLDSLSFGRYILVTWDGFVQNGSLLQVGFFEIMSRISTIYTLLPEDGLTPYLPNIDENRLKFSQGTLQRRFEKLKTKWFVLVIKLKKNS